MLLLLLLLLLFLLPLPAASNGNSRQFLAEFSGFVRLLKFIETFFTLYRWHQIIMIYLHLLILCSVQRAQRGVWVMLLMEINQNKLLLSVSCALAYVCLQLKLCLSVRHNYWTCLDLAECLQKQFRSVEAAAFATLCLRIIINLPLRWLLKFRAVVFAIQSSISRWRRMQHSVCSSDCLSIFLSAGKSSVYSLSTIHK